MPWEMERIDRVPMEADLFVSIGTSGKSTPPPASSRPRATWVCALEMNLDPSLGSYLFNESRTGKAGELVPLWVKATLEGNGGIEMLGNVPVFRQTALIP